MKKKRIQQYNEINEEVYAPKYWSKAKLILIGFFLLITGFLLNFPIEEKLNKYLETLLAKNAACPIHFEKIEFSYFMPKIVMKKPVIQGACFGQPYNALELKNLELSLNSPSFYPPGLRFHLTATSGESYINLYPVISFFSLGVKIEKTIIDTQMLSLMMENGTSPLTGLLSMEGFFEFHSGVINDGQLLIASKNLVVPAQRIAGFDLTQLNLKNFNLMAHFDSPGVMTIDNVQVGGPIAPIEITLKGKLKLEQSNFLNSMLELTGTMRLSEFVLTNFAFVKLFLPENKANGNYKVKIEGPLHNPGAPKFF